MARQHAGVEGVLPEDPVELALAISEQRLALAGEVAGASKGHGRQRGEAGILPLPPVTGFVVVGHKEADARRFIHPFDILAGEGEGVARAGAERQLGGQRLLHHGLYPGLVPLIRLYAQIFQQRQHRQTRLSGVVVGARAILVGRPVVTQLRMRALVGTELAGTGSRLIQPLVAEGAGQLHRCQQGAVVVDDVLDPVIKVGKVVFAQMQVAAFGGLGVAAGIEVATDALAGGAGQRGDSYAAPLAETRLPVGGFETLLGGIGAQLALGRILAPLVEQGHEEEARLILHPAEEIGAVQRLVIEPLAEVHSVDIAARGQQFPALEQSPHHHGGLLGGEVVGVGEVAQVLAHVAAGIEPAAVHIFVLVGAKQAGDAVGPIKGAAGALPLEVVNDIGETAAGQQILADGKTGGADYALGSDRLQPIVAGLLEGGEVGTPVSAALPAGDAASRLQRGFKQDLAIIKALQPDIAAEIRGGGGLQQGDLVSVALVAHLIDQEFHQGITPVVHRWAVRHITGLWPPRIEAWPDRVVRPV